MMILKYLKNVIKHKWFVLVACRKLGAPLWLGVIHDWSKFTRHEFIQYARNFFGSYPDWDEDNLLVRFPSYTGPTKKSVRSDFDKAWNHHQKHNKHHWQYWVLINDEDGTYPLDMPRKYVIEMVADWMGASKAYTENWCMVHWMNTTMVNYLDHMSQETIIELYAILHTLGYVDSGGDGWYCSNHELH